MNWLLDLSLHHPASDLALDEALLETAENNQTSGICLRIWEPQATMVVLGRSSRLVQETNTDRCRQDGVPILRRCSGGASIVTGPGCLMYAVVVDYARRPELRMIENAHRWVLATIRDALRGYAAAHLDIRGTSDLAREQWKVSGNSMRCKRDHFLYHGTLLYDFPLELVSRYLRMPPRQPDYRNGRPHVRFLANLDLDRDQLRQALIDAWSASEPLADWPAALTEQLVREKYSLASWNERI